MRSAFRSICALGLSLSSKTRKSPLKAVKLKPRSRHPFIVHVQLV